VPQGFPDPPWRAAPSEHATSFGLCTRVAQRICDKLCAVKRILLIVGFVLLVILVVAVITVASAFMGRRAIPERTEVNGVAVVKDGIVSIGIVPLNAVHAALIDAGTDASGKAILAELARRNLGPDAVTAILLTHGHQDHIAGVPLFPAAKVMALAEEVSVVEGRQGTRGPLTRLIPVKPTGIAVSQALHDGETVWVDEVPFRVFATPGHTRGSAAYLVRGVLFVGDAADISKDGKTVRGAPWIFSESQPENRASLVRLYQRLSAEHADVAHIAFAHSGVLSDGLKPLGEFSQQWQ